MVASADRSQRAIRRRYASPTQAGYLVTELCAASPGARDLAPLMAELAMQGPAALDELMARFPGPLWHDPRTIDGALPPASQIGPIPAAFACLGVRAYPVVAALLASSDPEDRLCAAAIAGDFPSEDVLMALAALTSHADGPARRMALRSLPALARVPAYGRTLLRFHDDAACAAAPALVRMRAIDALAHVGDRRVIPTLVPLLRAPDTQLADAAHRALCSLTAHDYGHSRRLWARWLSRVGHLPRHAWLLEGLRAHRGRLRRYAVAGLSDVLGEPLEVGDDCSRTECIELAERLAERLPVVGVPR